MYDGGLDKLMEREVSKWWEITTLEQYMECKRVPSGLRIFTVPTYDKQNPLLLKAWTANSEQCSLGMMQILIKFGWEEHQELVKVLGALKAEPASGADK